ncbi:MAG: ABC transporter permease, partial [Candidatus Eisenbacteria bacterium]
MSAYLLRRLLAAIPLVLGISTLVFFVVHLAPGDPTAIYWNPDVDPEVLRTMRKNLGLDDPLPVQYVRWLAQLVRGDFGYSFGHRRPVIDVIGDALPNTLVLSLTSMAILFVLGVAVGVISAVKQYSWTDHVATVLTFFFYSMPSFWFALMLLLIFHYHLRWFPADQMTSIDFVYDALPIHGKILDRLRHLVLPAAALGLGAMAGVARYTRASVLEVIRMDYIRTARAKGLPERDVIVRHTLRNALLPVITLLGLYFPFLFSGAVLVETIFGWPGMGRVTVTAIFQRDYPLILANTFVAAL